jgi:hypothetical protein
MKERREGQESALKPGKPRRCGAGCRGRPVALSVGARGREGVMIAADRFRLLFGPSRTPRFRYGRRARCAARSSSSACLTGPSLGRSASPPASYEKAGSPGRIRCGRCLLGREPAPRRLTRLGRAEPRPVTGESRRPPPGGAGFSRLTRFFRGPGPAQGRRRRRCPGSSPSHARLQPRSGTRGARSGVRNKRVKREKATRAPPRGRGRAAARHSCALTKPKLLKPRNPVDRASRRGFRQVSRRRPS